MAVVDSAMTRECLRDIAKRPLDVSSLEVHVSHGVVYLRGRIDKVRGYHEDLDLGHELAVVMRLLRQKPGIRDVCCEVEMGPASISGHTSDSSKRSHYY